jgi:S-DNA-T family DNA segregation ATPase FtsK/SpoIIIE
MQYRELELQADRIEMLLREHKAPARVTGGNVTPRFIQFTVQAMLGVKINRIEALSREIALALGAPNARITTQDGALRIEVPRADPQPVTLLPLLARLPQIPSGTATLGLADDGAPLLLRLPSPDVAHVLVAGTTGSGKTALVQTMIVSLAMNHRRSQLQLALIDPKGRAFEELAALPHLLCPIVSQADRAIQTLREMTNLMEQRDRTRTIEPCVVIVIDELADLAQTGGSEVIDLAGRLVQRGRQAGVHVIAATQKPSSSIIGPLVKANFPVRLVGRVVSSEDARVAAGVGGTRAERLSGHGDFVAVSGSGIIRFQAAFIAPDEMRSIARQLAEGKRRDEIAPETEPTSSRKVTALEANDVLKSALRQLRRVK